VRGPSQIDQVLVYLARGRGRSWRVAACAHRLSSTAAFQYINKIAHVFRLDFKIARFSYRTGPRTYGFLLSLHISDISSDSVGTHIVLISRNFGFHVFLNYQGGGNQNRLSVFSKQDTGTMAPGGVTSRKMGIFQNTSMVLRPLRSKKRVGPPSLDLVRSNFGSHEPNLHVHVLVHVFTC
jgi:hypothetical protein